MTPKQALMDNGWLPATADKLIAHLAADGYVIVPREPTMAEIDRLLAENERLRAAVDRLLDSIGRHPHLDTTGRGGADCPVCQRQQETIEFARRALEEK